ncbi:hypothetical protein LTR99_002656 [Exophiala xenobiotica]|uniref:Zn(2)-C6 fungal-type domain-containing protein n=1 Tax=Vermiconidia calcicola TaxID=1690605 RepID=A0AAV9QIL6_9PEZI|nr:hypothetical protein LTR96_002898 [Exophiala xenobiotica]KAK5536996.1 hypothetical protein LTR23_007693 [Chaetothyriales sp. CCFEE 6169]KAK5542007.1 hypothetical protein LTR25_001892 [Vermiconidia calcicola]KAK5306964.1 hypothetical protein LTR99_002656 [Exophiala xenobiotica]KAK5341060.1 hypothetical protein LTR98_001852 [Exophiala xenobiotica]
MGRRRRQSGHLQGCFPLANVAPRPRGLSSTQQTFANPPPSVRQEPYQQPAVQHRYSEATDPLSPVSNRSTLSHGSFVHSASTSYTSYLAEARHLSPDPPTPTSSSISTYTPNHHTNGTSRQPQCFTSGSTSDPDVQMTGIVYSNTPSDIDSTRLTHTDVLGIDLRLSNAQTQQYVGLPTQYVSDRGPSPTSHQRYPHSNEPWAPYPFRHEDLYLSEEEAHPAPGQQLQDDVQTQSSRERRGGRSKPLSPAARKEASDVRRMGACLRCTIMREKCDLQRSCQNCCTKERRKFPKACIRAQADWRKLKHIIFPNELTEPLRSGHLFPYLSKASFTMSNRPHFRIPLDLHVGTPLHVTVKEFHALDSAPDIQYAYRLVKDSEGHQTYCRHQVWSPPINVFIQDGELQRVVYSLKRQIKAIFEQVLGDPEIWDQWTIKYFPSEEEDFQTDILRWIGKYYRSSIEDHLVLKTALSLLWYEHLLLMNFEVLAEALPFLEAQLESGRPAGLPRGVQTAPETINRFLKGIILPMAEEAGQVLLERLHELMFRMAVSQNLSKGRTDIALCLAFVLLIFLGRTQHTLLLLADTPETEPGRHYTAEDAEAQIHKMEEAVTDYLLSFHKYTLSRKSPRSPKASAEDDSAFESHAKHFDLVGRLRKEVGPEYASKRPDGLEVGALEFESFRHTNVPRLCWRLLQNLEYDGSA